MLDKGNPEGDYGNGYFVKTQEIIFLPGEDIKDFTIHFVLPQDDSGNRFNPRGLVTR